MTTRLHCALPCLAVDILVIFFGNPDDYRTSIIEELGLDIHKTPHLITTRDSIGKEWENTFNYINWTSDPIDIHIEKDEMIQGFARMHATIFDSP